jgi:hypothetical protein
MLSSELDDVGNESEDGMLLPRPPGLLHIALTFLPCLVLHAAFCLHLALICPVSAAVE